MTVATVDDVPVEIPTRIWRVQYVVRTAVIRDEVEEHDEQMQVIWFETEGGMHDFLAEAWMSQQADNRQQTFISSVHRVLVESYSEVEFSVGTKVQVTV